MINTITSKSQIIPDVSNLKNGGFVVIWYILEQGENIFGQIFNSNGDKIGNEFQVNTTTLAVQRDPKITTLQNGKFVVTWFVSYYNIYAQIFNSDGTKHGVEFQVNTSMNNYQTFPSISKLFNDGFIITCSSNHIDLNIYLIYGQLFDNDGNKIGNEFQVNTDNIHTKGGSKVTLLPDNKFVVVWATLDQDGSDAGIYGQIFNKNGNKYGSEFQINTYTISYQEDPDVIGLKYNGFIVSWSSFDQDGDNYGIFAQIYNNDGTKNVIER